ncbi:MAG: DCC1-like thiol-disulfide oxidoreductase family protein [Xenococcaceae cyanobacterium]
MVIGGEKGNSNFINKLNEIFGLDLRSLALFRVGLALVVISDLVIRFGDARALFSDEGVLPRVALIDGIVDRWYWSINLVSGQPFVQQLLFLTAIFMAVLMLVGYRTRLAVIASWAMIISIHNRNPALVFAGDDMLRAILFWSMFLPLGACYSIDSALNTSSKPLPKRFLSFATVALIVQLCFIYMLSAWFKHQSPLWSQEGSAVYYALSFDRYATGFGQFLLGLPIELLKLMNFGALWFEWLGALLLFIPFRTDFFRCVAIVSFILLHFSFGLSFTIGIFPALCIAVWLAFIPSSIWEWLLKRTYSSERKGLKIYYDAECGFCKKVVHFIRTFLILPGTPLTIAQDDESIYADMQTYNSWVIVDWQEKRRFKWEGIAYVVSLSPIIFFLAPVLRFPPLMAIGTKIYETIASNRKAAGKLTAPFKYTSFEVRSSILLNVVSLILLLLVTLWNFRSFANHPAFQSRSTPVDRTLRRVTNSQALQKLDWLSRLTRLDQSWSIFAPNPPRDDGWHVIVGTLEDGSQINVLGDDDAVNWEKPTIQQRNRLYRNMQWRTYFINLNRAIGQKLYPYYSEYLCRDWSTKHTKGKQLKKIDIYFMDERTVPPGETQNVEKKDAWQQSCSK